MLNYIAVLIFATFIIGLIIALVNLFFGAKASTLADHAENIALSSCDWKTTLVMLAVLYVILAAVAALVFMTGYGACLLYIVVLPINMNMGNLLHYGFCALIHKAHGAPVPMPAAA